MHVLSEVAPVDPLYFPAAQLRQAGESPFAYEPAGHELQEMGEGELFV